MANQEKKGKRTSYPALRVHQWLADWDGIVFRDEPPRRKPSPCFYITSMPAKVLRILCGVEPRTTNKRLAGEQDLNIQRPLDEVRVTEIANYVKNGFPWSELSDSKRQDPAYRDLRMPGWLPTAIVINVKQEGDERALGTVHASDLVEVVELQQGYHELRLPESYVSGAWRPIQAMPIEVIDGQHRLFAFGAAISDDFELPVVAFVGLDISWQAYLFYVINIKPKRINPSLAYDLYPLLRNEDWLAKLDGHQIYRDTRSQELTQSLWSYRHSPWHLRINMLGSTGQDDGQVKQASWVRNLSAAMVKNAKGRGRAIGGLFGGEAGHSVPWTRTEQAAFLVFAWGELESAVRDVDAAWTRALRSPGAEAKAADSAFKGKLTLLNTDQGVRGVLHVINDLMMVRRMELELDSFSSGTPIGDPNDDSLGIAIQSFKGHQHIAPYVNALATCLAQFDWRTSDAPDLTSAERTIRKSFRGSGGYKELRVRLLDHISRCGGDIAVAAGLVSERLGYEGELE